MARTELGPGGVVRELTAAEEASEDAREQAERERSAVEKRFQASQYRLKVLYANAFSEPTWNIMTDPASRMWFSSVNNNTSEYLKGKGRLTAEGVNTVTGEPEIREVNQGQWNALMDDVVAHDKAAQLAYLSILDRVTALGADYEAIRSINVRTYPGSAEQQAHDGAAYPWPPFYVR